MKSFLLRIGLLVMLVVGMGWDNALAAENENPSFQEINRLLTEEAIKQEIPPEVLKSVAWVESGWRQFLDGKPYISSDGGIGIMQITNKPSYDQTRLKNDVAYNIQVGAEILSGMYGRGDLPKLNGAAKSVIESWYFPVMAYNGTKPVNSPIYQDTDPIQTNEFAYQEKVFKHLSVNLIGERTLARYPFSQSDFTYNKDSTENIKFNKMSYTLMDEVTMSHATFNKGSNVVTTVDKVKFRTTPSTTGDLIETLTKGEILTITGDFAYETSVRENQFVWYPVKTISGVEGYISSAYLTNYVDVTKPEVPKINPISDKDTVITGIAEKNTIVYAYVNGQMLASATVSDTGSYSINIPKQSAGTKVIVKVKDAAGNVSADCIMTVIDKTAPTLSKVNVIDDNDKDITGITEKNASVDAYVNGKSIGSAKATSAGSYSISIAKQKAGNAIVVKARDTAGNVSAGITMKVIDRTAPGAPRVNTIDDNDTVITGTAEKGSRVYAYVSGKSIGDAKANSSTGKYSIKITKKKAGTKIVLKAKDAASNYSSGNTVAVKDKTPPAVPKANTIDDNDTIITGTAEKGSRVYVYVSSKSIGNAKANSSTGKYSIKITKRKAGTKIVLKAKDAAGNYSSGLTKTVIDKTPPAAPKVNKVTSKTTKVTGTAEKNATVKIYRGSTHLKTATVNSKGSYTLSIKAQKKGTVLSVYAYDKAKNKSKAAKVTVK